NNNNELASSNQTMDYFPVLELPTTAPLSADIYRFREDETLGGSLHRQSLSEQQQQEEEQQQVTTQSQHFQQPPREEQSQFSQDSQSHASIQQQNTHKQHQKPQQTHKSPSIVRNFRCTYDPILDSSSTKTSKEPIYR